MSERVGGSIRALPRGHSLVIGQSVSPQLCLALTGLLPEISEVAVLVTDDDLGLTAHVEVSDASMLRVEVNTLRFELMAARRKAQDALAAIATIARGLEDALPGDNWHAAHAILEIATGEVSPDRGLADAWPDEDEEGE